MAKQQDEIPEVVLDELASEYDYMVDEDAPLVDFSVLRETIDPVGAAVKAREFSGRPFYIEKARKFESSFEGQEHAYFVVVRSLDTDERYNFVVGGAQPLIVLTAVMNLPPNQKIGFGLKYTEKEDGKSGFYTLIGANEIVSQG